jgi:hypothetical protein
LLTVWLLLIHAENFMTGLKVVFDRERSVLGWHEFDCKFIDHHSTNPSKKERNVCNSLINCSMIDQCLID